jgi:hypothetical protein
MAVLAQSATQYMAVLAQSAIQYMAVLAQSATQYMAVLAQSATSHGPCTLFLCTAVDINVLLSIHKEAAHQFQFNVKLLILY